MEMPSRDGDFPLRIGDFREEIALLVVRRVERNGHLGLLRAKPPKEIGPVINLDIGDGHCPAMTSGRTA